MQYIQYIQCLQHDTVQYSIVQYSTVQYSTVQYSTVQCFCGVLSVEIMWFYAQYIHLFLAIEQ